MVADRELVEGVIEVGPQRRVGAGHPVSHGVPDAGGQAARRIRGLLLDHRATGRRRQRGGQGEGGDATARASRHG